MTTRRPRDWALKSRLYQYWTMRDAERYAPFTFRDSDRQAILQQLRPKLTGDAADELIRALQGCVMLFKARREFEGKQAPDADVRKRLESVRKCADQLQRELGELDWATRRVLAPHYCGGDSPSLPLLSDDKPAEMTDLDDNVCDASEILADVSVAIDSYLGKTRARTGRRPALIARQQFALEIADSLRTFAPHSIKIKAVARNPFETVLAICLCAATGAAIGDLHRIASKAVARQIVERPS